MERLPSALESLEMRLRDVFESSVFVKHEGFISRYKNPLRFFSLTENPSLKQFIRFAFVGVLNTIVGYGSFFLLLGYVYYLVALVASHFIGVTHSFVWNKYWVFKVRKLNVLEYIRFNLVYLIVLVVNAAALVVAVNYLAINPRISQLFLLPVITLISFFGQKYWSFKKRAS
jgi:putative flippase GtrA